MIDSIPQLLQVDFTSLLEPVLAYATHTAIAPSCIQLLTACTVHYDLDFGLVLRYLSGEYTAEWRNIDEILSPSKLHVTHGVLNQMERILTTGCPLYLKWEEEAANKRAFVS